MDHNLIVLLGIVFIYSLVAKKIEASLISGPMIFVALGILFGPSVLDVIELKPDGEMLSYFAELTLALVLFTDASSAKIRVVTKAVKLPERMLLLGLPLTILLGLGTCLILFNNFSFVEAAIIAIILAPTDAALGKAVVSNPKVPAKIRESLNIESGLNDGICVPFLLLSLAFVDGMGASNGVIIFFIKAIGIGALVGASITIIAAWLIKICHKKGWISKSWEGMMVIVLTFLIFALSEYLGGSGFIACFVGGLCFGILAKKHKEKLLLSAEGIGDTLALVTWTLFGIVSFQALLNDMQFLYLIYAVLSLSFIRMIPIFLSLFKSGVKLKEKIFMGWFGPRGLASIVFVVMILDKDLPHENTILSVVLLTILLSVVAHGITANPLAEWIGKERQ